MNGDISGRPALQIGRRDADLPAAVGVDHGGILDAVDGDGDVRARCQVGTGAGHGQILLLLDGVDHIIARNGIHPQARKLGVDVDITLAAAGVAVGVGDRSGKG